MQDDEFLKEVHKIMNREIGENFMDGEIEKKNFMITQDGMLVMKRGVSVPNVNDLRKTIMEKAHCSAYVMHPDSTKMYRTIKENYWWSSMKRDIAEFVSKCLVCQQVKAKHQKPVETLQLLPIPE